MYRASTSAERLDLEAQHLELEARVDAAERKRKASIASNERRDELEKLRLATNGGDPNCRYKYALALSSIVDDVGMTPEDRDSFVMTEMRTLSTDGYWQAGVWLGDALVKRNRSYGYSPSTMEALAVYRRVLTSSLIDPEIASYVRREIGWIEEELLEHQDDERERAYTGVDSDAKWREIKLILDKCESPPERKLLIGLIKTFGLTPNGGRLEGDITVEPQFVLGKYRADFIVNSKVIVEVDGWEFHKHKIEQDKIRDQRMMLAGYLVLRFPANQVNNSLDVVLRTIAGAVDRHA